MTVQELFKETGFDNIMSALGYTHQNDGSIQNAAAYKEAYDILCNLEPDGKGGEVTFNVTPRERWYDADSLPMLANGVEGDWWETIVGKEVVRPQDNPFTDAELAGAILWGATFYGFTSRSKKDCRDDLFYTCYSRYGAMAKRLIIRKELLYAYSTDMRKSLKRQLREPELTIALTMKQWDWLWLRKRHLNRSKRKREYRMKKKIEWLKKMDKRQHMVDSIIHAAVSVDSGLADKIFRADSVQESWRESHVFGKGSRVEYLMDLIANYYPYWDELVAGGDELFIIAYTSAETPLSDMEENALNDFFSSKLENYEKWTILPGNDNSAGPELALQFIVLKYA